MLAFIIILSLIFGAYLLVKLINLTSTSKIWANYWREQSIQSPNEATRTYATYMQKAWETGNSGYGQVAVWESERIRARQMREINAKYGVE